MKSLSGVGLGLSLVFGCLLLALVAELYYLLWWKKRITNRRYEEGYSSSPAKEFLYMFCWRKPSSLTSSALNPQELCSTDTINVHEPQAQIHSNSNGDLWFKPFGGDSSTATELMRLQDPSAGPPRFLFTIREETKEDLESEDAKSRDRSRKQSRSRSLSDLVHMVETPFLTPLASPSYFTPPLTPVGSFHNNNPNGFNPFFESASDAEFNRLVSTPSPKFKFLKDAEEKLYRKKLMEEAVKYDQNHDISVQHENDSIPSTSMFLKDEDNGSFITLIVASNRNGEDNNQQQYRTISQCPSSSSQVLPLASSPPTSDCQSDKKSLLRQNLHQ